MDPDAQTPLTRAMDIMFTLIVLYTFVQWRDITSVPAIIIYIFTCLVVLNDWFSFRATADIYIGAMFIADISIAFILVNMIEPLKEPKTLNFGYAPSYWVYLGVLTFIYMLWDLIVAAHPQVPEDRKGSLRKWGFLMGLNALLSFGTYLIQFYYLNGQFVTVIDSTFTKLFVSLIPLIPAGMYTGALFYWNKEKFEWVRKQILRQ